MKSKEALERLIKYAKINEAILITKYGYSALNDINIIKQDLERLESLEEENEELQEINESFLKDITKLVLENEKLKKVIEHIKALPPCDICDSNWHKGCLCLQSKIKKVLENE